MKKLKLSTILLALACAGCLNEVNACGNVLKNGPTNPTPPSPAATPTPTPTFPPSTTPAQNVSVVQINGYGPQACPAGVATSCDDGETCRTLPVGCERATTCTAFTPTGQDAAAVIPGLAPTRFDAVTGASTVVSVRRDAVNPLWNIHVKALAVGPARFECTVSGVSTNPSDPFVLQVLTPSSTRAGYEAQLRALREQAGQ